MYLKRNKRIKYKEEMLSYIPFPTVLDIYKSFMHDTIIPVIF